MLATPVCLLLHVTLTAGDWLTSVDVRVFGCVCASPWRPPSRTYVLRSTLSHWLMHCYVSYYDWSSTSVWQCWAWNERALAASAMRRGGRQTRRQSINLSETVPYRSTKAPNGPRNQWLMWRRRRISFVTRNQRQPAPSQQTCPRSSRSVAASFYFTLFSAQ